MEDRIIALEEKFAFLEKHVEDLDSVVKEAFDAMGVIRIEIKRLQGHLEKIQQQQLDEEPGE